jgi:hypothetical protein
MKILRMDWFFIALALGKLLNVETPASCSTAVFGGMVHHCDYFKIKENRTSNDLDLNGMTMEEIHEYLHTGIHPHFLSGYNIYCKVFL